MRLINVVATDELIALPSEDDAMTVCRVWKGLTPSGEEVRLLVAQHGVNERIGNFRAVKAQLDQLTREGIAQALAGGFTVLDAGPPEVLTPTRPGQA